MLNRLMMVGALLLLVTAMSGQAVDSAIKARMTADLDRTRGNNVTVSDQTTKPGRSLDLAHVRDQTVEMNQLVVSINADVVGLQKGVLAADLHKKLKRLEKLAKDLRQSVE
jgi:hypothetical protein